MKTKIEQLRSWIAESKRMVFFGGAGVSTESGIPDFRSVDGLYHQKFDYPPETIISHSFFLNNPEYFYRFYREKMLPLGFEPNVTHRVLARLEQEGHLAAVVTQNIDGLHQAAGSRLRGHVPDGGPPADAGEPPVRHQGAGGVQAHACQGGCGSQHLPHSRATLRAFITHDHHVA